MILRQILPWLLITLLALALSCARQTSPTGGPKDTIPPVLVRSVPPNEALNFKSDKIELHFSEAINLNSPKEQLIVTPTINKDYKINFRKNIVTVQLAEPLRENTTYTFNFRDAVQDITERNPARNLTVAYSTGDYIDSLSIEGSVYDLLKGKPVKDATVALHVNIDTFNIFLHTPLYFTKTDDDGKFRISHLKPDTYFIYAFEDKNRNIIVNSRTESYAFKSQRIELSKDTAGISLGLVRLDAAPLRLTSARPYNTYYNIRTTKNLRTFTITASDSSKLSYAFGDDRANIKLYNTTDKDSLLVHLLAYDSIDNTLDTAFYAKFSDRQSTPEKFQYSATSSSLLAQNGLLQAQFKFTKPIAHINYDSIYFQVDSLTRIPFAAEDFTWETTTRILQVHKTIDASLFTRGNAPTRSGSRLQRQTATAQPQPEDKPKPTPINELHLRRAAFISVENDSSSAAARPVPPAYPEDLAIVNMEIRTDQRPFIVQLLDNNFQPIAEQSNQTRTVFRNVVPGTYQIRLIIDHNENGRWDPGNYFRDLEPEPIIYYMAPDATTIIKGIKANWEIGADGEMFITY